MADTVRIEGLDLVQRNLRKVRREAPTAFATIQQEIAAPIVAAARRKARKRTGRMASTIRVAPVREVLSGGPVDWVIAGEGTEYTGVQHGGWPGHGISPNPFLTDAVDQGADAALADYDRRVGVFLERTWVNS